jgi:hypothetical protein
MENRIAALRWLAGIEDRDDASDRTAYLRSARELTRLAVSEGFLPNDGAPAAMARLMTTLHRDRWVEWTWQVWPNDSRPEAPGLLTEQDLDRVLDVRVTAEGYTALAALGAGATSASGTAQNHTRTMRDCFISHAGADKNDLARPLAEELDRLGFDVWYDEFELEIGDSLREKIEEGLATSLTGVVILSEAFFERRWPQEELNGLVARETSGGARLILPIWHGIDAEFLVERAPMLADRVALHSEDGVDAVAEKLARTLNRRRGQEAAGAGGPIPARTQALPSLQVRPGEGASPLDLVREEKRVRLGLDPQEHAAYVADGGYPEGPGWLSVIVGPARLRDDLIDPSRLGTDELREIVVADRWDTGHLFLNQASLRKTLDGFRAQVPDQGIPGYWMQVSQDGLLEFGCDLVPALGRGDPALDLVIPTLSTAAYIHDYALLFLAMLEAVGYQGEAVAQAIFNHVGHHRLGVERARYFGELRLDRERVDARPVQGLVDELKPEVGPWTKRTMDRLFLAAGIDNGCYFIDAAGELVS